MFEDDTNELSGASTKFTPVFRAYLADLFLGAKELGLNSKPKRFGGCTT